MFGSGRQRCSSGQCSCQCGWAGFALLKKKDGARQSPDFPALFNHPHQWLGPNSWAVPVTIKQTQPRWRGIAQPAWMLACCPPGCGWCQPTFSPVVPSPSHRTAGARECSRSAAGIKVPSLETHESICVDGRCGSHLLVKQRKGSSR